VLRTDLNGRLPEAGERCVLGLVDLEDGNRFIPVTTTACWNFQEAAMAHWMNNDEILFNDVRDGRFRTVIMNWRTKKERVLPMPVAAVSEDRTWAVSVNYARLSLTRPDYGYAGPGQDPRSDDTWPEDEPEAKKRPMTFTLSGITGSNNPQSKGDAGAIRKPTYTTAPTRTGVAESSEKSTYGIPLSVGAGIRIGLSEKWSVGIGIDYTLLSRKFYGTYIKVNEKGEIQNPTYSNIRNNQHYIGIPVNFFYNIIDNSHLNFYAFAGGSVEKCVADTYALINTSIVHREDIKGVQVSAAAGLGVEFLVGKHLGLYVDPRIRYYFNCRQPKSIRTEQPLMAGVEMGFRIRL
jgi:opacity protein-like surface antigen